MPTRNVAMFQNPFVSDFPLPSHYPAGSRKCEKRIFAINFYTDIDNDDSYLIPKTCRRPNALNSSMGGTAKRIPELAGGEYENIIRRVTVGWHAQATLEHGRGNSPECYLNFTQ